ncbi:major facilitator superfamily domain-containing protein [Xylariales sp. AK1849]|nr:major facilitator superfamily domain-containing protein [Xylariales sp. AK1849]
MRTRHSLIAISLRTIHVLQYRAWSRRHWCFAEAFVTMNDDKFDDMQLETVTRSGDATPAVVDTINSEESYKLSFRTYAVLFCLGVTWGTCTMANVGPSTTYQYAVAELGGASLQSWIPNAALFPLIGLQPMWGALADRFGKRWFIVSGGLIGVVGNVVAGTAKSTEVIIGGQAINGIGSSLFLLSIPTGMEIVPASHRSLAQGMMGLINGLASIMVLVTAGVFAKMSVDGWRWVFYFNAIFFGVSSISILLLYNPPATKLRRENSRREISKSIDFLGIVLLLCAVVDIVTSLTWGGNAYPWNSSRVIAFLVLGGLFIVAFALYERFGRNDGLIDHRFLGSRNFLLVLAVAFIDGMLLYGINVFFPIEAAALFTTDPVRINIYLLPLNILVLVGILGAAFVLGYLKHYRILLVVSVALIALCCGLLALATPERIAMMLVLTGLVGLGVGVTTVIPVVIMSYAVPSHLLGTAGTLLASVRALGGTIGITIFASIYGNLMTANLPSAVANAAINAGLPASSAANFVPAYVTSPESATAIAGVTTAVLAAAAEAVRLVTVDAFKYVWIANAAIGVATAALTLFLLPVRHHMTGHIESSLDKGNQANPSKL